MRKCKKGGKRFFNLLLLVGGIGIILLLHYAYPKELVKVKTLTTDWKDLNSFIMISGDDYILAYDRDAVSRLAILDISNPAEPVEVVFNEPERPMGRVLEVNETYAYLDGYTHNGTDALRIVDISNIANPVLLDAYEIESPVTAIAVQLPYAYLTTTEGELYIFDVSNPKHVKKVALYIAAGRYIPDVAVSGDYAYILVDATVEIIDISNPATPVKVNKIAISLPNAIAIQGNNAFITNGYGLQIFDISNALSPKIVSSHDTPYHAETIALEENFAYIGDGEGFEVVDISNVHRPRRIAYNELPQVEAVIPVNGYVYVLDLFEGLIIYKMP